jgi:hypothetical protein
MHMGLPYNNAPRFYEYSGTAVIAFYTLKHRKKALLTAAPEHASLGL